MRRIKLVVMTVGVALSVAPIFNSAFAQQRNNQANLLLDVQSMRQEIAQLRDMVERQQFEMRKVKRLQQEMQTALAASQAAPSLGSQQFDQVDGASSGLEPNPSASFGNEQSQELTYQQQSSAGASGGNFVNEVASQAYPNTQEITQNGTIIEERVITAAPQNSDNTAEQEGVIPIVDRSFSQQVRDVPVTGNGSTLNGEPQATVSDDVRLNSQPLNDGQYNAPTVARDLPSNVDAVKHAVNSASGGVIAIPKNNNGAWVTNNAPAVTVQSTDTIVANSVPIDPSIAAAKSVLAATDNTADSAPTLSEDDYYGQGFELLKQSKYEEASTIFERQIKAYPRGNLADDAHYWIAEAMHVSRKLDVSKQHLKTIINDYPQSPRLPDAMLKTAYIEQSQGNKMEAQILFQEIVSLHPKSDAAIAAKNQLAATN